MRLFLVGVLFLTSYGSTVAFSGGVENDPVVSEQPAWFEVDTARGGFYGYTTLGTYFTQYPVLAESGVRLHKFTIAHVAFYVSDRGVIYADSDLGALSQYLALG